MQQTETTTVQTGPTTAQAAPVTVETGPTTVQAEPATLHDFTLGLLTDLDAREAFQQDPLGCLEAAGLSDITAGDVHEILPLVLDAASVPNVDVLDSVLGGTELPAVNSLLQIADNVEGVVGAPVGVSDVAGIAAPSALTALVSDFSGLGDVSSTLDGTLSQVTNVVPNVPDVSHVTDIATDNALLGNVTGIAGVTDLAGVNGIDGLGNVHDVTNVLVKDVDTDVLVKNVIGAADVAHLDVSDVADVSHVTNVTDNVVQNVAQVGDVHHDLGQVIGDVKLGDIDLLDGGIGNHNNIDLHL